MYPRITHLCLSVASLAECLLFYRRYCQLQIVEDRSKDGRGSVYLAEGGAETGLILQLKSDGERRVASAFDETHIGFEVDSKGVVDLLAGMARAEGIIAYEPDEYLPGSYFCGIRDPNGNCVEFGHGRHSPPESLAGS